MTGTSSLSVKQVRLLDHICDHFEAELKLGKQPQVADWLHDTDAQLNDELRQELNALIEAYQVCRGRSTWASTDAIRDTALPGAALPSPPFTSLPVRLGRYRLERPLGEGGMGSVYLAEDLELERQVAVKIPKLSSAGDSGLTSRFRREARAAAMVQHPHLCPIHDVGEFQGIPFLVMGYIEGVPLSDYLSTRHPLPIGEAVRLVRKLAEAMQTAHARNLLHRDLKPSNVMMTPQGEPVILDFGLAHRGVARDTRLTQAGMVLGTPTYMPLEQAQGSGAFGPRCDIYSLGVILYELLTGQAPFDGHSPAQILAQLLTRDAVSPAQIRPAIPLEVERVCLKAMAKRPDDRYETMDELALALAECETILLRQPPPVEPAGPPQPAWHRLSVARRRDSLFASEEQSEPDATAAMPPVSQAPVLPLSSSIPAMAPAVQAVRPRFQSTSRNTRAMVRGLLALSGLTVTGLLILLAVNTDPEKHSASPAPTTPPELRASLPAPGSIAVYQGKIRRSEANGNNTLLDYTIELRCVGESIQSGKPCRRLEIEVRTDEFIEQAILDIDLAEYEEQGSVTVREGYVVAGAPFPDHEVVAPFKPDADTVLQAYQTFAEELPAGRLSVHDVLALLFRANVQTTHPAYRHFHQILATDRMINGQELHCDRRETEEGIFYDLRLEDSPDAGEDLDYSVTLCPTQPFSWISAVVQRSQPEGEFFFANLIRVKAAERGATRVLPERMELAARPQGHPKATVPTFTATIPEPGGSTTLQGSIWHQGMGADPQQNSAQYTILLRCVGELQRADRLCRWLEIDVQTGDFQEQARLLVDVRKYQLEGRLEVLEGYLLADGKYPNHRIATEFNSDVDRVRQKFEWASRRLPPGRLSVHDVLALLFAAQTETSIPLYARLHRQLALERAFLDQQLDIDIQPDGEEIYSSQGENAAVEYKLSYNPKLPFRWQAADIRYTPRGELAFLAELKRVGGVHDARSELPDRLLLAVNAPAEQHPQALTPDQIAYLTLPRETGHWARYSGKLLAPVKGYPQKMFDLSRVEVRVLGTEPVEGIPHRWLEVDLQIGEQDQPHHHIETARLLINEAAYQDQRKFEVARGWVRFRYPAKKIDDLVPFDPETDQLRDYSASCDRPLPFTRLPLRDVLSLLFNCPVQDGELQLGSLRNRIWYALVDNGLKRTFTHGVSLPIAKGRELTGDQIQPSATVPIQLPPPLPGGNLKYTIDRSAGFPFNWVNVIFDLRGEGETRLFSVDFRLREFGTEARTGMPGETEERLRELADQFRREADPSGHEAAALAVLSLAEKFLRDGEQELALKRYQKILNQYPDTHAATRARERIDILARRGYE